jgi:AraC family transcriptional regulator of arabinose operon
MMLVEEVPHAPVLQLLTGHFHATSGYRAYRHAGVEDWLLIYTASGLGRFGYHCGELISRPGDWVLLRPGTLHDYGVEPSLRRWELLWAHFQPRAEWLELLAWPAVHKGLMRLAIDAPEGEEIAARFLDVHRLLNSDQRRREAFAMNALEAVLLRCDRHNPLAADERGDDRVRRAMDFLERNLERKTSLDEVAAAVGLSTSRLAHLFKAVSGQTPQRYLEARRMQHAAELLQRTSFSVKQIAAAVGFDSQFYFSQRFKAWTQQSPVAFRQAGVAPKRTG